MLNTSYDSYKDTLLSLSERNVITRESIFQIINRKEDNIKNGLPLEEVIPFLKIRIYNLFYQLIFKYDPDKRNHHNQVLYCMMIDNHIFIYTIKHDAISLQHVSEGEDTTEYTFVACDNYHVKEREAISNLMIDNIDDIL